MLSACSTSLPRSNPHSSVHSAFFELHTSDAFGDTVRRRLHRGNDTNFAVYPTLKMTRPCTFHYLSSSFSFHLVPLDLRATLPQLTDAVNKMWHQSLAGLKNPYRNGILIQQASERLPHR